MSTESERTELSRSRLAALLALTAAPVLLTSVAFWILWMANLPRLLDPWVSRTSLSFFVYALTNWVVFGLVVWVAGWRRLRALGLRLALDRRRVIAAGIGFGAGVAIYIAVTTVLDAWGIPEMGGSPQIRSGTDVAVLLFSTVLTAAFCEEVFFRVLWVGGLSTVMPRGPAAVAAILAFATIHYPYFGLGGVIFIMAWSIVAVALFLIFRDISASFAMHLMNNAYAYLVWPLLFGQWT